MRRYPIAVTAMLALCADPALADSGFDTLDSNHDGYIKETELYGQLYQFGRWDRNHNGMIEKNEFQTAGFHAEFREWDRSGDGEIDSKELYDDLFAEYDADKNGRWYRQEWRDAVQAGLLHTQ